MSKIINVKINGLDRLQRRWKNIDKESEKILQQGLLKSGLLVERNSKKEAPVDKGRLRSSIFTDKSGLRSSNPKVKISPRVKYAIYVHEGHRQEVGRYVPAIGKRLVKPFVKGNPFMTRGYKESKTKITAIMKKAMDSIVKKMK